MTITSKQESYQSTASTRSYGKLPIMMSFLPGARLRAWPGAGQQRRNHAETAPHSNQCNNFWKEAKVV